VGLVTDDQYGSIKLLDVRDVLGVATKLCELHRQGAKYVLLNLLQVASQQQGFFFGFGCGTSLAPFSIIPMMTRLQKFIL
jgi:hypothetical protein